MRVHTHTHTHTHTHRKSDCNNKKEMTGLATSLAFGYCDFEWLKMMNAPKHLGQPVNCSSSTFSENSGKLPVCIA